ncbi:glycosyl transferase [Sulfurifustis variabilis]|uniref:Glycosyl transferase n=2 Tax=Sulfurifustis variabilis TaxID=1675686 RepID=A0A1B4V629_9GAMM|nr:glycosyl transferase [Sulfurifustis variabilis]
MTKGGAENSEFGDGGVLAPLRRLALRLINDFIAISSPLRRGLLSLALPHSHVHLIPNGVDVQRFAPRSAGDRREMSSTKDLPADSILLLCTGVIDKRKNQHLILAALAELRLRYVNLWERTYLLLAGPFHNSIYSDRIIRQAGELRLRGRVKFLGSLPQDELAVLNGLCDICVFAGNNEGLPNVLLEAKAAGKPIIAFRADGVEDIVREGIDGHVVDFGDVAAFTRKLSELIEDNGLRYRFGQNARLDALERFSIERIADRYMREVYRLDEKEPAGRPADELAPRRTKIG